MLEPLSSDFDADGALSRAYLLRRGTCCENGCRHCPYGFPSPNEQRNERESGDATQLRPAKEGVAASPTMRTMER